eukprot:2617312-Prymnesium_polylepis.1
MSFVGSMARPHGVAPISRVSSICRASGCAASPRICTRLFLSSETTSFPFAIANAPGASRGLMHDTSKRSCVVCPKQTMRLLE